MQSTDFYREQANRARRLARQAPDNFVGALEKAARDYEELARDLDRALAGVFESAKPPRDNQA